MAIEYEVIPPRKVGGTEIFDTRKAALKFAYLNMHSKYSVTIYKITKVKSKHPNYKWDIKSRELLADVKKSQGKPIVYIHSDRPNVFKVYRLNYKGEVGQLLYDSKRK